MVVVRGQVVLAGAFVIHVCDSDVTEIAQSRNSWAFAHRGMDG